MLPNSLVLYNNLPCLVIVLSDSSVFGINCNVLSRVAECLTCRTKNKEKESQLKNALRLAQRDSAIDREALRQMQEQVK